MKKSKSLVKTILTLFIFFSISIAAEKSYKILSTDIQTTINNDGTINFVETREFSFKGDFTFVYQVIPKRGFDKIYDIQVSENGVAYLNKDTKQDGTFLIDERKNSFWSDNIPKNPLTFISQTIKIEKFFNSLLSRNFNILVY